MNGTVHLAVHLSAHHTFFTMFLSSCHQQIFRSKYPWQWCAFKRWNHALYLTWHRNGALLFFLGHPANFKVTQTEKVDNLALIVAFPNDNSNLRIHRWLRNDTHSFYGHERSVLFFLFFFSDFKVTLDEKLPILKQLEHSWTLTLVGVHRWLQNWSLKWHRRGALLLFKAISEISRSYWLKNLTISVALIWDFLVDNSNLNSQIAIKWCTYTGYRSMGEVPYCFVRLSVKFQGNTGQKIDDLDTIWARLLGQSQLSNPSDLPCETMIL